MVLDRQQLFTENTLTVILPLLAHPNIKTFLHIVILLTYPVALGGFAHIIAGSVDMLYLVNIGSISWGTYFLGFMLPTLIGNIFGGVSLVAALNFGQVAAEIIGNA